MPRPPSPPLGLQHASLGALCLALAALVAACSGETSESAGEPGAGLAPAWTTAAQVGRSEACRDCHPEQVESWSRTGMARALGPVELGELDGLAPVAPASGLAGFEYRFVRTPDRQAHVIGETHAAFPEHAFGAALVFGIGAGELDRSYALAHGSGLYFAPLEVLTVPAGPDRPEPGRRAVPAPHESIEPGQRFGVPITAECIGCHTDQPPPATFPLNALHNPGEWQPVGVTCAACHGEWALLDEHLVWQEAELSGEAPTGPDPLARSRAWGRIERLSVCAACHLQGDARILLEDRVLGPPAPGGDLLDQRAVFVAADDGTPGAELGFVSQVERLVRSACFLESTMDCSTCHDPHRSPYQDDNRRAVRAACTSCHGAEALASDHSAGQPGCSRERSADADRPRPTNAPTSGELDCVDCHMPRSGVFDVAEVTIHDHYIRREAGAVRPPSRPDELRFPESPSADWQVFGWPGEPAPGYAEDAGLWMLAHVAGGHSAKASARIDGAPGPAADRLAMYHHVRASLLEASGRYDEAVEEYREALERDPELAPSAINLGLLLSQLEQPRAGLEVLDAIVERYPNAPGAHRNRALVRLELDDRAGCLSDLIAAFGLQPEAELAATIAGLLQAAGQSGPAAEYARLAHELDPRPSAPAAR